MRNMVTIIISVGCSALNKYKFIMCGDIQWRVCVRNKSQSEMALVAWNYLSSQPSHLSSAFLLCFKCFCYTLTHWKLLNLWVLLPSNKFSLRKVLFLSSKSKDRWKLFQRGICVFSFWILWIIIGDICGLLWLLIRILAFPSGTEEGLEDSIVSSASADSSRNSGTEESVLCGFFD